MVQSLGETRESMAWDCWRMAEDFASKVKSDKPFYVAFHAKPDASMNAIRQAFKAYSIMPKGIIGLLVWYVDRPKGIFEFKPELSSPPDVPVDPSLLSDKSEDQFTSVMQKGKDLNVLVS